MLFKSNLLSVLLIMIFIFIQFIIFVLVKRIRIMFDLITFIFNLINIGIFNLNF